MHPFVFWAQVCLIPLLPFTVKAQIKQSDQTAFEALAAHYVDQWPALSPVNATSLGDHRFDHQVDDVSAEARQRTLLFLKEQKKALLSIHRDRLPRDLQVDFALLQHELDARLWRLEILREWEWNPLVYTSLTGNGVYSLLSRNFAPLPDRLRSLTRRLEAYPRVFEQVRATLDMSRVPHVHAETAVKQNKGLRTLLDEMVFPHVSILPTDDEQKLRSAAAIALEAAEQHQHYLENQLLPAAQGDFRIGADLFDTKLRFALHTPMSRQQVKARATREFHKVRDAMYALSKRIYLKEHPYTEFPSDPSPEFKQTLTRSALEITYRDMPGRAEIVATAESQVQEANQFIIEKKIVTPATEPLEIILMPEFRRGVSFAYCDSPGPLDKGLKTYYAVSPIPDAWTEKQVASFLREYNLWSMHDLTMHEAIPGHYLQLAHANQYPSTLRAMLSSGTFIEGWAVYSERVMVNQGYLDGDDRMALINLKWYLRGITNALMDQAIHVDGMTRDEAMRLMIEGGFQEEREAAGKWTRAQLTSAQLSTYFVGTIEHWDMRNEVEETWGSDFRLLKYHDQALSYGSPPVQYVKALILDHPIPSGN